MRAPCQGLWESSPLSLPKATVPPHHTCYDLKNLPKSREPNALLSKTSITPEFTLMSMEPGIAPHVSQPLAWHSPSNSQCLPEGDPPAH